MPTDHLDIPEVLDRIRRDRWDVEVSPILFTIFEVEIDGRTRRLRRVNETCTPIDGDWPFMDGVSRSELRRRCLRNGWPLRRQLFFADGTCSPWRVVVEGKQRG